jgi:xanthine dioxygenase
MRIPSTPQISSFQVDPYGKTPEQKFNFGATVTGLDLNDVSTEDVDQLRNAC